MIEPTATEGEAATTAEPFTVVGEAVATAQPNGEVTITPTGEGEHAISADLHQARDELAAARRQLEDTQATVERLTERIAQMREQSNADGQEHEAFKEKVLEVAMRYASEHRWCGVVADALREMGLELPLVTLRAEVTIEVNIEALVPFGTSTDMYDVRQALDLGDDNILTTPSDWDDVGIELETMRVANVRTEANE